MAQTSGGKRIVSNFAELLSYLRTAPLPRRVWVGMTVFTVLFALTEGAGVGLLMPVLVYVEGGREALQRSGGGILVRPLEMAGLPINLATLLIIAIVPFLVRQLCYLMQSNYAAEAQYGAEATLRTRLLASYIGAPLLYLLSSSSGTMVSAIMQEAGRASTVVWATAQILTSALLLLVYVIILAVVSPLLTAIALPLLMVTGMTMKRLSTRSRSLGAQATEHTGRLGRLMGDSLGGIRLIKMRGVEPVVIAKLTSEVEGLRQSLYHVRAIQVIVEAMTQPIIIIGAFALFYLAIQYLSMSLSLLGLYLLVLMRTVPVLVTLNTRRLQVSAALEGARELRTAGDLSGDRDLGGGNAECTDPLGEIRFEDVHFSHWRDGEEIPVLRGVDLTIHRGETVALVGPSGAGKSTLIDLLARFYAVDQGRIMVDGVNIETYAVASLRRRMGLVGQDAIMFNDTLRENLIFGLDVDPGDEAVWSALDQAHCRDFVSRLPAGLETIVGERGLQMSGGQRQRLALARALLCHPDLLILDEPTSALDSVSEAQINSSLAELKGRMTMLIIAHRLATVQHADRIVVLDHGRVVDAGTHPELVERDGLYRDLFRLQKLD
jgi:subfamily B ATP-binding cassette protein MsbA